MVAAISQALTHDKKQKMGWCARASDCSRWQRTTRAASSSMHPRVPQPDDASTTSSAAASAPPFALRDRPSAFQRAWVQQV